MKTGVLFSGGKDSCLALYKFGKENIDCLLSLIPETPDSFMFHKADLRLLEKQAEMLELPLILQETKGEKEKELSDLIELIKKSKIKRLIIGGIKSNYQGERIRKICQDLKVELVAPLWGYSVDKLWQELLDSGFKVILTKISCQGISKEFLGRIIDYDNFEKLKKLSEKYKFGLDFEGGEAESAALFMPGFKQEIGIDYNVGSEGEYRHFLSIKNIYVFSEHVKIVKS